MAFFGTLSVTVLGEAEPFVTPDGVDAYKINGVNTSCPDPLLVTMIVDKSTETGSFLKQVADLTASNSCGRVLVTGVVQSVLAIKGEDKSITKQPKLEMYVGSARRLRPDLKKEPEQAVVMGAGYCRPITEFEDPNKRKAELFLSAGTESVVEEGKYSSQLHVVADKEGNCEDLFRSVEDGKEVYFMGYLFRSKGEMNGTEYDKIKVSATFAQETERVQQRRGGGKRTKSKSMRSQLDSSFEDDESPASALSPEELTRKTLVSLADF